MASDSFNQELHLMQKSLIITRLDNSLSFAISRSRYGLCFMSCVWVRGNGRFHDNHIYFTMGLFSNGEYALLFFFREVNIHQSPLLHIVKKIHFRKKCLYNLESSLYSTRIFWWAFCNPFKINRKWLHLHFCSLWFYNRF